MKCPSCSTELADSAKFCPECGEKIVRRTVCPDCGTEVAPGAKFCAECGHKFAVSAPAPARGPDAVQAAVERAFKRFHDIDGNCRNIPASDAKLVKVAADGGDPRAVFLLGQILCDGGGGFAKDPAASSGLFRRAAELGDPWGMLTYGTVLAGLVNPGCAETDGQAALTWIQKGSLAVAATADALSGFGAMLSVAVSMAMESEDGSPDLSAAVAIAGQIAEQSKSYAPEKTPAVDREVIGGACFVLSLDARNREDYDAETEWLLRGAEFGNADCQKTLDELDATEDG